MASEGDFSRLKDSQRTWGIPWSEKWIRPKGNIDSRTMAVLAALGCLPIFLSICRYIAFPDVDSRPVTDPGIFYMIGAWLNQWLSLQWVPPGDLPTILYLLLLPTGALIIALARLTFGLRVLGFRAILIAIGFQIAGFVPSMLLLLFVVAAMLLIRPWMRHIRLPLYARVAVIFCVTAMIMVGALLLAPLLRSEVVWGVAFFPVIIVAMMAEGIAKTLANDNAITAAWRAGWTLIVALIFTFVSTRPTVRELVIYFPEVLLTQLVMIVMIAEFFDLRLMESWPDRLAALKSGKQWTHADEPIVAVVRNRWNTGIIGRLGLAPSPKFRKRSVQRIVDALRNHGFRVKVFEGDIHLIKQLSALLAPDPTTNLPGGLVLNLATGVQGNGRFCQVPGMLELAGVAYTGPDPTAQANMTDRYVLLSLLQNAGVAVPRFALLSSPGESHPLDYPVAARPRCDIDEKPTVIYDQYKLEAAVRGFITSKAEQTVVEEIIYGREIRVSLIGNERLECLPLLEMTRSGKRRKVCPARIDEETADSIREMARKAYIAAGCRDYARIDVRLSSHHPEPVVIAVLWDGLLARYGSTATSARAAGYDYEHLILRIVEEASLRYWPGSLIKPGPDADAIETDLAENQKQLGLQ